MTQMEQHAAPSGAGAPALQSDSLFRRMFEHHAAIMLLIDPEALIILEANNAASRFYGYPRETLRGMDVSRINAQPESEVMLQRQQAISGEKTSFVFNHRLANGEVRSVEAHISTIHYGGKNLFFSLIHDITERKQLEEQILSLAFYDPLTKLANRRLLNDRLAQTMAASKRSGRFAALMMLDLDDFKLVNDSYGHTVGDTLLEEVAQRLKSCIREVDTVARFGGDEFVVLLSQLDMDRDASISHATTIAEKIRARLAEPYFSDAPQEDGKTQQIEYSCTPSIGIAVFTNYEATEERVLQWADSAMYRVKASGGNRILFHDSEA